MQNQIGPIIFVVILFIALLISLKVCGINVNKSSLNIIKIFKRFSIREVIKKLSNNDFNHIIDKTQETTINPYIVDKDGFLDRRTYVIDFGISGSSWQKSYNLGSDGLHVGRGADNDVSIKINNAISSTAFNIGLDEGGAFLKVLNQQDLCKVENKKLRLVGKAAEIQLNEGDVFSFAGGEVYFRVRVVKHKFVNPFDSKVDKDRDVSTDYTQVHKKKVVRDGQ